MHRVWEGLQMSAICRATKPAHKVALFTGSAVIYGPAENPMSKFYNRPEIEPKNIQLLLFQRRLCFVFYP